jgi:hypothetical protein
LPSCRNQDIQEAFVFSLKRCLRSVERGRKAALSRNTLVRALCFPPSFSFSNSGELSIIVHIICSLLELFGSGSCPAASWIHFGPRGGCEKDSTATFAANPNLIYWSLSHCKRVPPTPILKPDRKYTNNALRHSDTKLWSSFRYPPKTSRTRASLTPLAPREVNNARQCSE